MTEKTEDKQLGYFIIHEDENTNLIEEYLDIAKHYKQRFNINSSNYPHHTYFTHTYIKEIRIGNFANFGRVICMFLYSKKGYRYNKEDIDFMLKIIKKFIGRNIDFFTTEKKTADFYGTTPILFSEKQFHVEKISV